MAGRAAWPRSQSSKHLLTNPCIAGIGGGKGELGTVTDARLKTAAPLINRLISSRSKVKLPLSSRSLRIPKYLSIYLPIC